MNRLRKTHSSHDSAWPLPGYLVATLVMAAILSAPALVYLWQRPVTTNILSAVLSIGFFCGLLIFLRSWWLQLLIGIPVMILSAIEIVHILAYGDLISLGGIEAILYVDPHEAREFATDHLGTLAACLMAVPLYSALARLRSRAPIPGLARRALMATLAISIPMALLTADLYAKGAKREVYLPTRIVDHYASYFGSNPFTHTLSGIISAIGARTDLEKKAAQRLQVPLSVERSTPPADHELHIVVLGESSRRHNWQLYGYGRPTNPKLAVRDRLVVFKDAVSPATITSRSVPLSFTFATADDPKLFNKALSFVSMYRLAGFKTYWLSNQGAARSAVGSKLNLLMDEAEIVRTTNFGFWNSVLDEALLPELDRILIEPEPRKLVIIHTLGSHTNYRQRYPEHWNIPGDNPNVREIHTYKQISDEEAAAIADYDRSIAYSDMILDAIIQRHEASNTYGTVTYFSDHGQRLYDDAEKRKGHGFRDVTRYDAEIPLLIWTSEKFEAVSPDAHAAIATNAEKPVSTSDLAQSLIALAGIRVVNDDPHRSFFSRDFVPQSRNVLGSSGRSYNYDALVAESAETPIN